jgi:hypothetical protein
MEVVSVLGHPRIRAAAGLVAISALVAAPATAVAKRDHDGPAKPSGPTAEHAATQGTTPCSILTPGVAPGVISTSGHYTVAANGNGTLVCHGSVPVGPPRTIVLDGLRCPTPAGITWQSHTVITRSGNVTLTCHFKAPKDNKAPKAKRP